MPVGCAFESCWDKQWEAMPMVTDRTEGMAIATLPMSSIRRFSIQGHVNKTKTIEYISVWNMTYIMPVFPFPELGLFLQRRTATWKSELIPKKDQTKKKMTSKSGKKQVQKVNHKDFNLNWLVFSRWLTPSECSLPKPNKATSVKFAQFCFSNIAWKGMVVALTWSILADLSRRRASSRLISLNFSSNYVTATTTDSSP